MPDVLENAGITLAPRLRRGTGDDDEDGGGLDAELMVACCIAFGRRDRGMIGERDCPREESLGPLPAGLDALPLCPAAELA